MRYDLDLTNIPLDTYREILAKQNLLPSRRLLLSGLAEKMARLTALGIHTVSDLLRALSSPAKIEAAANASGIAADYLKILKQEAGTLKQKPVPLQAFPDTDTALIESLHAQGIKTSKDYWENPGVDEELYALCDLARINGVGPYATKMLVQAGYHTAADIAGADTETLLARVTKANATKKYYRDTLGIKDMQFCIDSVKILLRYGGA